MIRLDPESTSEVFSGGVYGVRRPLGRPTMHGAPEQAAAYLELNERLSFHHFPKL